MKSIVRQLTETETGRSWRRLHSVHYHWNDMLQKRQSQRVAKINASPKAKKAKKEQKQILADVPPSELDDPQLMVDAADEESVKSYDSGISTNSSRCTAASAGTQCTSTEVPSKHERGNLKTRRLNSRLKRLLTAKEKTRTAALGNMTYVKQEPPMRLLQAVQMLASVSQEVVLAITVIVPNKRPDVKTEAAIASALWTIPAFQT